MKINKIVVGVLGTIVMVWVGSVLVPVLKDYFKPGQLDPVPDGMVTLSRVPSRSNSQTALPQDAFAGYGIHTFLPFDDNFEAYTNGTPLNTGTNGWYGSSCDIVVVSDTNIAPAGSMNIAMIPVDCTLSHRFADIPYTNVWIQMDVRPSLYDGTKFPVVATNVAVMFYVNSNGNFVVHNGPASPNATKSVNWVTLTNFNVGMNGTNWVTIGIYEDFNMRIWHLYAGKTLVANNIKFINQSLTQFTGFEIYNGSTTTTYLANVSVAISNRSVLTVTGSFTVSNKIYDASTTAAISNNSLTLLGTRGGEDVKLMAVAVFSDKHVGRGKRVSLTKSRLTGTDAGNYTLSLAGAPTSTGDITKANAITVTAADNVKVYDGTMSAMGMPTITGGRLVGGDTATWSEAYTNKDVGTGKTLIPSGTVNDDNGGSNYMGVTFAPNYTGTITKKTLSAALVPPISKVYDGNNTATLGATNYALSGFVGRETCMLTNITTVGAYATANAGTGILVTATLASTNFLGGIGGFSTNNYTLPASVEGNVGDITKTTATVTLYNLVQTYKEAVFINGGTARTVTNTTVPAGLTVVITYDGSIWGPVNAGSYAVTGTVIDVNYQGTSTGTLTISK